MHGNCAVQRRLDVWFGDARHCQDGRRRNSLWTVVPAETVSQSRSCVENEQEGGQVVKYLGTLNIGSIVNDLIVFPVWENWFFELCVVLNRYVLIAHQMCSDNLCTYGVSVDEIKIIVFVVLAADRN